MLSTQGINKLFSQNLNLQKMNKKLATPLLDSFQQKVPKGNELKKWEDNPLAKAAYTAYHDDVIDGSVSLTPESEKAYIEGFLSGTKYGMNRADKIHESIFSPTINRHIDTGIVD